jgi:hypothetical protein
VFRGWDRKTTWPARGSLEFKRRNNGLNQYGEWYSIIHHDDHAGERAARSPWGNRTLFTGREYLSDMRIYATESLGLLRGWREGTHYVSDAVNSDAARARQRLSLGQTPGVGVTLEVPAGYLSAPSRVAPRYKMSGGGMQRTATGPVPVKIKRVDEYRKK